MKENEKLSDALYTVLAIGCTIAVVTFLLYLWSIYRQENSSTEFKPRLAVVESIDDGYDSGTNEHGNFKTFKYIVDVKTRVIYVQYRPSSSENSVFPLIDNEGKPILYEGEFLQD